MSNVIALTAPSLDVVNIHQHVTCVRPKRRGGPRIEVEHSANKLIIHNYGHGGFGWSMLPGSVLHSLSLLEQNYLQPSSKHITIIGAGCMGLLTAIFLKERGWNPEIIAEEIFPLTSHKAAGSLSVIAIKALPEKQSLMDQIMVDSHLFYRDQVMSGNPVLTGIAPVPVYMIHEGSPSHRFPMIEAGVMKKQEGVEVFFGGSEKYAAQKFDTFFLDTKVVMQNLMDKVLAYKISIIQKQVLDFLDVKTDIIFNCSGLGARRWEPENMIPVQGHLVKMENQPIETRDYILYAHIKIDGKFREVSWTPNGGGILGGTSINMQTSAEPNPDRGERIIENARLFFGGR